MNLSALVGIAAGLGLAAGIRLYSTVLVVGLGIRFGLLHLPKQLEHFSVFAHNWVLAAAAVGFLMEFFADKIPWVDSLWDSIHTFIRPAGAAAMMIVGATAIDPAMETVLGLLAGGMAFTTHSSKAAARLAVNHSPEPFSNVALSLVEEAAAPVAWWFFLSHPYIALGVAAGFVLLFAWIAPKVWRIVRLETAALASLLRISGPGEAPETARRVASERGFAADDALRCAATRSISGLKNSIGWLFEDGARVLFVARLRFRWRTWERAGVRVTMRRGLMLDTVVVEADGREHELLAFKPLRSPHRDYVRS